MDGMTRRLCVDGGVEETMATRRQVISARRIRLGRAGEGAVEDADALRAFIEGFDRAVELVAEAIEDLPGSDARGFDAILAGAGYEEAKLHLETAMEPLRP